MHDVNKSRQIKVEKGVMDVNDRLAMENRKEFGRLGLFVINVMSSPGSGKTTLLTKTLEALKDKLRLGVVVGDICTTNDADRLALGGDVPVKQICTEPFGGDCHLAAHIVMDAAKELPLEDLDVLIVENLGNLVCPAEFDVGEDKRVVLLSVTEGEDKPLKYPLMFQVCDLAMLTKTDLLPHLDYDLDYAVQCVKDVHPDIDIIKASAKSGEGMAQWLDWFMKAVDEKKKEE